MPPDSQSPSFRKGKNGSQIAGAQPNGGLPQENCLFLSSTDAWASTQDYAHSIALDHSLLMERYITTAVQHHASPLHMDPEGLDVVGELRRRQCLGYPHHTWTSAYMLKRTVACTNSLIPVTSKPGCRLLYTKQCLSNTLCIFTLSALVEYVDSMTGLEIMVIARLRARLCITHQRN
jgi:hypothetical protein